MPWKIIVHVGKQKYSYYASTTDFLSFSSKLKYEIYKTNPKKTPSRQEPQMSSMPF